MPHRIIIAKSIASTVRFHCPDEKCAAVLDFVRAEPITTHLGSAVLDVEIEALGNGNYDFCPPQKRSSGSAEHIVERAHLLLRRKMIDELPGTPVIHGGSLRVGDRRFILPAKKGTGKTTFLLKCLSLGMGVEGDEHVVVREHDVIARPRTLRIKPGSADLIPELKDTILASPYISDWSGTKIYSFSPQTPEVRWQISPGVPDHIVFLEANHSGLTSIRSLDKAEAFSILLNSTILPLTGKAAALARLHVLLSKVKLWNLKIGELDIAVWHLQQLSLL